MTLVLDTGALIALERGDRAMWRRLKGALDSGDVPITHGGVVGQAWRGKGRRAALLAHALAGLDVRAVDEALGRRAGALLARVRRQDVIDAALVLLASDGDVVVTSDASDLDALTRAAGLAVALLEV